MAANTAIEWATHTFNPWTGCTRVSPGCDNCYAAAQAKRNPSTFGSWEPGGARKRTSAAYWQQPLRWNREAERTGTRPRVFCASMADVFDNQVDPAWRQDLWELIHRTPHLDWLLLTKRPQNIASMLPMPGVSLDAAMWPWPNVWLGTTVENQAEADRRIPHLLQVPARVRFLSCEPLLGPVDLTRIDPVIFDARINALTGVWHWGTGQRRRESAIHWVICGGESGPGARPMHPDWARSLRDQCAAAGVPFFFKQWGEWAPAAYGVSADKRSMLLNGAYLRNVGKKTAGRLLDGAQHDGVPHA